VSANFLRTVINPESGLFECSIYVKSGEAKNTNAIYFEDKIRGYMRMIRKLSPREEDNFALNKITMLTSILNTIFDQISLYGWVIAGFSILVGGFGVANIMFVSVKERTSIIGIQKALGAPKWVILGQFLTESIFLCILGGLVGLLLIWLISLLISSITPFQLILTLENVLIGIGLSSFIGIISGFIPSLQAANLDPIEAIRQ